MKDKKKKYEKPAVVEELDLETKAGSPQPPCSDPLDSITGKPCG